MEEDRKTTNQSRSQLVSIVVPCFNVENSISKTLKSILNQTYTNWEVIIVNDGSTDRTKEVVLSIKDNRIKYFEFPENRGRGAARQKGLEESSGDYLAMVDADDWIYDDKLEFQVDYLNNNPSVVLVSNNMGIVNKNNQIVGKRRYSGQVQTLDHIGFPGIPHGPSMIRMSEAKKHTYDASLKHSQDSDFILKCVLGKKYVVFNEIKYIYTEYNTFSKSKILKSYFYTIKYISKYLKLDPIRVLGFILQLKLKAFITIFRTTNRIIDGRTSIILEKDQREYLHQSRMLNE